MKSLRYVLIAMAIACVLVFSGCEATANNNNANANAETNKEKSCFFGVEKIGQKHVGQDVYYYRDVATDVIYIGTYKGGLVAMQDPETGLPLTYTRYVELYEENNK